MVNVYTIDLVIPERIMLKGVTVIEMPVRNAHFDMILGMNVIKLGHLSIKGTTNGIEVKYTVEINNIIKTID